MKIKKKKKLDRHIIVLSTVHFLQVTQRVIEHKKSLLSLVKHISIIIIIIIII